MTDPEAPAGPEEPTTLPPVRRRVRRTPDARTTEIIDTALRLFAASGYRRTTVASVAAEVGITDAGVFHHFATKADLLQAVLDRHTQIGVDLMTDVLEPGGLEAIRRLGDWGQVMASQPDLLGFEIALSSEAIEPTSLLNEFFSARYVNLRRWLMRTIEQGIDDGTIRSETDAEHEVTCFVALLDGLRLQWYLIPGHIDLARHVRLAVDQLVDRIAVVPDRR